MGKTHMVLGILTTGWLTKIDNIETGLIAVGASIMGSLMPDVDHKDAILRKTIRFESKTNYELVGLAIAGGLVHEVIKKGSFILPIISAVLIAILCNHVINTSGHRGITHSLLGLMMFGILAFFLLKAAVVPFIIGYSMHLVGDMVTNSGIPLIYPDETKISYRLFDTGSGSEKVIYWLSLAIVFSLVIKRISELEGVQKLIFQ